MKLKILTTAIISFLIPSLSYAACTRADLTGIWKIHTIIGPTFFTITDSITKCTLVMPSSGTTISSTSTCTIPGFSALALRSNNLTISTDCHILGRITIAGEQQRNIDAFISKGKDSISGIGWTPGNIGGGYPLTGVKQ